MRAYSPKRVTKAPSEKKLYSGNLCASETLCYIRSGLQTIRDYSEDLSPYGGPHLDGQKGVTLHRSYHAI